MTRLKLFVINAIIVAGAIGIAVAQWPVAVGAIGDRQGIASVVLLECLIAGIPIVLWGVAAHFVLGWLLLRRGELDDYRARQEIERLPPPNGPSPRNDRDVLD